jgi:hypothetical protein
MWHPNPDAFTIPVFGPATKANSWEDLDLKSIIGSYGNYVARLVVVVTSAHTPFISFRPNSNSDDFANVVASSSGVVNVNPSQNEAVTIDVTTDFGGDVEWICDTPAATLEIYFEGYLDVEAVDPSAAGTASAVGVIFQTPAWPGDTIDLSSVSNDDTLFFLQIEPTGGTPGHNTAVRPADETDDMMGATGASSASGGCARWLHSAAKHYSAVCPSNNAGSLQCRKETAKLVADVFVHSFIDSGEGWQRVDQSVGSGLTPPTVPTTLDLSSIVGENPSYVLLKIKRPNSGGAGTLQQFAVRQKDANNTFTYLLGSQNRQGGSTVGCIDAQTAGYWAVPTNPDGEIEWYADVNTWTVDVTVVGFIATPTIELVSLTQKTLNSVDVVYDSEPRHIDPNDPGDATNPDNYDVTGPIPPDRLIQWIEWLGENTVEIFFDGELEPDSIYQIDISGIETESGAILNPPLVSSSFTAFGAKSAPVALQKQTEAYDIRNPQTESDAPQGAPLASFVIQSGDLDVETGKRYLRKRIWRRLGTRRGAMFHLPDYGLSVDEKTLATPTALRRLQTEIEEQISAEQDVKGVRAIVSQLTDGAFYVKISVISRFGSFEDRGAIGG